LDLVIYELIVGVPILVGIAMFIVIVLTRIDILTMTGLLSCGYIIVSAIGLLVMVRGLRTASSSRPPRAYENGITLIRVPFRVGWRNGDVFVPWSSIKGIWFEQVKGEWDPFLHMEYMGPEGSTQYTAYDVWDYFHDDIYPFVKVLETHVPDRLHDEVRSILDIEGRNLEMGEPVRLQGTVLYRSFVLVSIGFGVVFNVAFAFLFLNQGNETLGLLITLTLAFPISLVFSLAFALPSESLLLGRSEILRTHVSSDGIIADTEGWGPFLIRSLNPMPWGMIKRLELRFNPSGQPYCVIILADGQEVWRGRWIFKDVLSTGRFRLKENHLLNDQVSDVTVPKVKSIRWKSVTEIALVNLLAILLTTVIAVLT